MTLKEGSGVYFTKLNDQEKKSKLQNLLNMAKSEVTVWQKGSKEKHRLEVRSRQSEVALVSRVESGLLNSNLLVNFSLSGLNFFTEAQIVTKDDKNYILLNSDFYKSERRTNFRLLTDSRYEVYLYFKQIQRAERDSNVVGIQTKTSETGLFKNFLKMMSGEDEGLSYINDYLRFKVLDISVSGAAIQVGEIEHEMIRQSKDRTGALLLDFNGKLFEIPNGRIHYMSPMKNKPQSTPILKAGVEFLEIDTNLDEDLSAIINQTLRDVDKEFEDFLK